MLYLGMQGGIVMQKANQKHLTLEDRNYIEQALNQNTTFKEISKFLSKDPTTIAKEVKKHRTRKEASKFNNGNTCINRIQCSKKNVCGKNCHSKCNTCSICIKYCHDYEEEICPLLLKAPFVCNSCPRRAYCRLVKYYYRALPSYNQYKNTLSVSRQGANLSEDELIETDKVFLY